MGITLISLPAIFLKASIQFADYLQRHQSAYSVQYCGNLGGNVLSHWINEVQKSRWSSIAYCWVPQRHVSQPCLHPSKSVLEAVSYKHAGEIPVKYAHNLAPWKICLQGQTSWRLPLTLHQTLSHNHDVFFVPDWPWPAASTSALCYAAHLTSAWICPRGAYCVWL